MFGIRRRRRRGWPSYLRWRCDICGKERDDTYVSVITKPLIIDDVGVVGVTENIKYCNDNPDCTQKAKAFTRFAPTKRKE